MSVDIRAQDQTSLASVKAIYDAAEEAKADALRAKTAADDAEGHAQTALTNAATAKTAADNAQAAADKSLTQLTIIEDVAGTLSWISEHGTYQVTADTTVQEGTVYFIYDQTTHDYEPIVSPDTTKNPHTEGWYVLDVTASQSEYIMAHIAVTSRGLWVLPSGKGSGTTPASGETQADSDARQGSDYKALLSSSGLLIYDGDGALVSTFGESIDFSSSRAQHIGNSTAYVQFNPDNGGSLTIVGSSINFELDAVQLDLDGAPLYWSEAIYTTTTANGYPVLVNGEQIHDANDNLLYWDPSHYSVISGELNTPDYSTTVTAYPVTDGVDDNNDPQPVLSYNLFDAIKKNTEDIDAEEKARQQAIDDLAANTDGEVAGLGERLDAVEDQAQGNSDQISSMSDQLDAVTEYYTIVRGKVDFADGILVGDADGSNIKITGNTILLRQKATTLASLDTEKLNIETADIRYLRLGPFILENMTDGTLVLKER